MDLCCHSARLSTYTGPAIVFGICVALFKHRRRTAHRVARAATLFLLRYGMTPEAGHSLLSPRSQPEPDIADSAAVRLPR